MLTDFSLASVLLLVLTSISSVLFYRRIKAAQVEYENAKDIVRNIVLSFSRELSNQKREIKKVSATAEAALEKGAEANAVTAEAYPKIRDLSDMLDSAKLDIKTLDSRLRELKDTRQSESQPQAKPAETHTAEEPETAVRPSEAPKRDGVLSQLNPTELRVLELLDEEGEMTVPRVMERIGKTREHTARLLKKIFENGFIDRTTGSMPYKYKIRKELKELLKEQEKTKAA